MKNIERQPFELKDLLSFFGSAKQARHFAVSLGAALLYADEAQERGDSEDCEFENNFWCGTLAINEDGLYTITDSPADDIPLLSAKHAYDPGLDATFYLGVNEEDCRPWVFVRYEWKEDEIAYVGWWLERD